MKAALSTFIGTPAAPPPQQSEDFTDKGGDWRELAFDLLAGGGQNTRVPVGGGYYFRPGGIVSGVQNEIVRTVLRASDPLQVHYWAKLAGVDIDKPFMRATSADPKDISAIVGTVIGIGAITVAGGRAGVGGAAEILPRAQGEALLAESGGRGLAATEMAWGAPLKSAAIESTLAPKLTMWHGFALGNDLGSAGQTLAIGKYPSNVQFVRANPWSYTIDRPWGWTPNYNAGAIRGHMEAVGAIRLTSDELSGTYKLEVEQVIGGSAR